MPRCNSSLPFSSSRTHSLFQVSLITCDEDGVIDVSEEEAAAFIAEEADDKEDNAAPAAVTPGDGSLPCSLLWLSLSPVFVLAGGTGDDDLFDDMD